MKLAGKQVLFSIAGVAAVVVFIQQVYVYAPDEGSLGGPIKGLTAPELRKFYETREVFKKEFTPEEGLGPLFNGKSCFECHGQPSFVGGEGRDVAGTGVVRIGVRDLSHRNKPLPEVIAKLTRADVDIYLNQGGPALERKSITSEFPSKYPIECQVEFPSVPKDAELISMRHSPPLFGFGLIDAIPDTALLKNMFEEVRTNPKLTGRALPQVDPLINHERMGRFGWKCQNPTLMLFTMEALNVEMGITTFFQQFPKSAKNIFEFPHCIYQYLPQEPNDVGNITNKLTYFQSLLAPPGRGPITDEVKRGGKVFDKLQCSVCHTPRLYTSPEVFVVDPDSHAPQLQWLEIGALENKPVDAYSDFLVHQMGVGLADGIPQAGANGGEWRTTPLWGLRKKKFLLHDGRTTKVEEAILAHGGQATEVIENFKKLSHQDRQDLMAFLKSL